MNATAIHDVMQTLRGARWRMAVQVFLSTLAKGLLVAGAALVVIAAVKRWLLERAPFDLRTAVVATLAATLVALLTAASRRQSWREMAQVLDRLGGTRDRFLTALTFAEHEAASATHAAAVRECVQFLGAEKFRRLVQVRLPREAAWLLVPAAVLALLSWEWGLTRRARATEVAEARASVEDTAAKLERFARETEKANEVAPTEELKKMAELLQRHAEQLRAQAMTSAEAEKAELAALSTLEQMARELQKPPETLTEEERKALEKALAENEETKPAADALAKGDFAKAAEELEKQMQELAAKKDVMSAEKVQQTLADALKKLAAQKHLSEALQKLAPPSQSGQGSQALQQLAQMLRQMQQGRVAQPSSGGQKSAQTLQQLLAALQAMKAGEGEPKEGKASPQNGKGQGQTRVESFAQADPGAKTDSAGLIPGGQPGSEKDAGTTDTPWGEEKNEAGKTAQSRQLAGELGEGETLQQFLQAPGDGSKSARRYRELYETMAPAAQEAAAQEAIPLGSRFFIKRYFESIRPKE